MTTEQMMETFLWNILDEQEIDVRTFEEAGLVTRNKGLVVKLEDGSEFQLTIVKSN